MAVFGANFSELGRNMIADQAMRAQRTSDILRNLNATMASLQGSRDRRYATDAERDRAQKQYELGLKQEENNLAIETERNRLAGLQVNSDIARQEKEIADKKAAKGVILRNANSRAKRMQSTYESATGQAAEFAEIAKQSALEIEALKKERLKAKTEEQIAAIDERILVAQDTAKTAAAMRRRYETEAETARNDMYKVAEDYDLQFDNTGKTWSFSDLSLGGAVEASGVPAQAAPPGVSAIAADAPQPQSIDDRFGPGGVAAPPDAVTFDEVAESQSPPTRQPVQQRQPQSTSPLGRFINRVAPSSGGVTSFSQPQASGSLQSYYGQKNAILGGGFSPDQKEQLMRALIGRFREVLNRQAPDEAALPVPAPPRPVPQRIVPATGPDMPGSPMLYDGDTGSGPISPMDIFNRPRMVPAELLRFGDSPHIPGTGLPRSYNIRYRNGNPGSWILPDEDFEGVTIPQLPAFWD